MYKKFPHHRCMKIFSNGLHCLKIGVPVPKRFRWQIFSFYVPGTFPSDHTFFPFFVFYFPVTFLSPSLEYWEDRYRERHQESVERTTSRCFIHVKVLSSNIDSTLLFQIFVVTQTLTLSETATGPTSSGNQDFFF